MALTIQPITNNMESTELTYETAYAALQEIVRSLQDDAMGVDDLTAKMTEAAALIRFCRERLRMAEASLEKLAEPGY